VVGWVTVFEAIVTVREAIDHAELTKSTLRILFLDFKAFDKISNEYLFTMLKYKFSLCCHPSCRMFLLLVVTLLDVQCKAAGYPLHSHFSPSLSLPCVEKCHQVPNEQYLLLQIVIGSRDFQSIGQPRREMTTSSYLSAQRRNK